MYTCVSAVVKTQGVNQKYQVKDVNAELVRDLISQSTAVYLLLTHPAIPNTVSLDLMSVPDITVTIPATLTVAQWLTSRGNASLPTKEELPVVKKASVRYNDGFLAGYSISLLHPTAGEGAELPDSEMTDLRLTRSGMDYAAFCKKCLVTVNSLLHITDSSTRGIRVVDGGRSVQYANKNSIGIHSFSEVGELNFYPIDKDNVYKRNGLNLREGFTIKLPDEVDLLGKVVLLSLGGYLHTGQHRYSITGERTIFVEWAKIPFAERYFESRKLIDLSKFEDTVEFTANQGFTLDMLQALSDESILAYLGLSQSFIITVDTDDFLHERVPLERTGLPGRYYFYEPPIYPMQLGTGLMPEYIPVNDDGEYELCIDDNFAKRFYDDTRLISENNRATGFAVPQFPKFYASAYMLKMGKEFIEYEKV